MHTKNLKRNRIGMRNLRRNSAIALCPKMKLERIRTHALLAKVLKQGNAIIEKYERLVESSDYAKHE